MVFQKFNSTIYPIFLFREDYNPSLNTLISYTINDESDDDFVTSITNTLKIIEKDKFTKYLMGTAIDLIAKRDNAKLILLCKMFSRKFISIQLQKAIVIPVLQYCLHCKDADKDVKNSLALLMSNAYPDSPHIKNLRSTWI